MGEPQFGSLLFLPHTSPALLSLLKWAQVLQLHLHKEFMPDPHSSTEPHKSDRNSQEWRASPLRPASRHGHASRTQHSSAKHTEHDQHSEQAELFTILKVLSKNLSRISLVLSLSERNSFLQFVVWRFFLFACFCFPGILSVLILQIFSSYRYRLLCAQQ